jgi:hypothetical protein
MISARALLQARQENSHRKLQWLLQTAVRRVAEVLEVSRSQLHERLRRDGKPRLRYRKAEDAELLVPVRRLVDECPLYGHRRIAALLNRERTTFGLARMSHKRIYRWLPAQQGRCDYLGVDEPASIDACANYAP